MIREARAGSVPSLRSSSPFISQCFQQRELVNGIRAALRPMGFVPTRLEFQLGTKTRALWNAAKWEISASSCFHFEFFLFILFFSSFECNPVGSCCDDMAGIHFQYWSICSRSGRFCLWPCLTAQSLLQMVLLLGDCGFNSSSFWHILLFISLIAKGPLLCYLTTECQFKCL